MSQPAAKNTHYVLFGLGGLVVLGVVSLVAVNFFHWFAPNPTIEQPTLNYKPRRQVDLSGFSSVIGSVAPWDPAGSPEEISRSWEEAGHRAATMLDERLSERGLKDEERIPLLVLKSTFYAYEGDPDSAYRILKQARSMAERNSAVAEEWLYTIIYAQAVNSLRRGEDENCVECRGESACIFPIAQAAIHTKPAGSRQAIEHFKEYLRQFPEDFEARWLLNLAHMTLGEHPHKVEPHLVLRFERFLQTDYGIGKFRDVGHLAGVNRYNQAGGAILEDFDNDGLLDFIVSSMDPRLRMAFYRNKGDGTFEERGEAAGLSAQLGGLYCVQGDYDNDGFMDIFVPRGAWLPRAMRPSLLRNNGNGTFSDVTRQAGLLHPMNSNSAIWADYDNDGLLDLFVCGETQSSRLFRNTGKGDFVDVTDKAGLLFEPLYCKGATWIDYDNDGSPDLFLNHLGGSGKLFHNNGNGKFTDVTQAMGIDGPTMGFSCWAWDYDNDGWLDIFATSYDRSQSDVIKGLLGEPHARHSNKLFRNLEGKGFKDVTRAAGLDMVFAAMGSNFADFDNDGFLDFYLATGEPSIATLIPNRMFRNIPDGTERRFADITASSGTGHLQKGHAVACGDWRRDGHIDLFVQTGGAIPGDRFHNVLFLNPGQGNHWLTVRLVGKQTNRAAIGARIKAVTAGAAPVTVQRHVSSGSSFGANPLQQSLGLGKADRLAVLEVYWPTSKTTQVFKNVPVDRAIEITELAPDYKVLDWKPVPVPQ